MTITVSLVEDIEQTRNDLVAMLTSAGVRCLGAYATAEEALRRIPLDPPDVALVDIRLPRMSGIECVAELKARLPALEILMLTTYEESELIFASLRAGAKGYILKNSPASELVQAIRDIHAGGAPMSMQIARKVVNFFASAQPGDPDVAKLSKREHDVLTLLAKGYLYKEIADNLGLGIGTVRTHLKHIYEKLHVHSRTEAAARFLKG